MKVKIFAMAAFTLFLATASGALAQVPVSQPAEAPVEVVPQPAVPQVTVEPVEDGVEGDDRLICESQTVTGSRLAKRKICRTAEGWRRHEENTKDNLRKSLDRRSDTNADYGVANPYG